MKNLSLMQPLMVWNSAKDILIARSREQGAELFVHPGDEAAAMLYYLHIHAIKEQGTGICQITGREQARDFVRECMAERGGVRETEMSRIEEYFPGVGGDIKKSDC